jgi:hypothetical protein
MTVCRVAAFGDSNDALKRLESGQQLTVFVLAFVRRHNRINRLKPKDGGPQQVCMLIDGADDECGVGITSR